MRMRTGKVEQIFSHDLRKTREQIISSAQFTVNEGEFSKPRDLHFFPACTWLRTVFIYISQFREKKIAR